MVENNIPDWFKSLEEADIPSKGWCECPKCGDLPSVWIYNNGNNAICQCFEKYGDMVKAESILSYITRHNGSVLNRNGREGLRLAWNKYVKTGLIQKLTKGQW